MVSVHHGCFGVVCGGVRGGGDVVNVRTTEHRCAKCSWQGTGSKLCPNYRPVQVTPYEDDE